VSPGQHGGFHIFLSYRREPNAIHAGRLHDSLIAGVDEHPGFTEDQIFMDIDTIAPGDDFREVIADAVAKCDVFLAVIGKQWATIRDKQRGRRLDNPGDYVRLELEAALERDIPVIPVLVDGAKMPSEKDLPQSLSPSPTGKRSTSLTHAGATTPADSSLRSRHAKGPVAPRSHARKSLPRNRKSRSAKRRKPPS
jgi:hypothetical protein